MRSKSIILLAFLLLSTVTVDAQFKKWVNKQKEKITTQVDPKEYLKRKINENYQIQRYINNINYKFGQIKRTINDNTTFYKRTDNVFGSEFRRTNAANSQLVYLEKGVINENYPVTIINGNEQFDLYLKDNNFIAVSDQSIPVNNDLRNIIATAYWSSQTKNINNSYISNLKTLSGYTGDFSGYMLVFYDRIIYIFDALEDMEYANISAADVIDIYARIHAYNFSVHDANQEFKSMRNDFDEIQNMAERIFNGSNTFLSVKQNLINTGSASYSEVQKSLDEFNIIAADLNSLADAMAKKKREAASKKDELSQLSNFSGIDFVEDIGDLFGYLVDYFQELEDGIRGHANNFSGFVSNINTTSDQYYNNSKSSFENIATRQINAELTYIQEYIDIRNNIIGSDFKNIPNANYTQYLNRVNQMNTQLMKAKEVDFVEFHKIKSELRELYNNFPVADAKDYYQKVLVLIDDKQIIGGDYCETYYPGFTAVLDKVVAERSKMKELKLLSKDLDEYYNKAKSNNTTFFLIVAGVSALIIAIIIIIILRKRRKKK